MSQMKHDQYAFLSRLSDEALEEIIQADTEDDGYENMEVVRAALEILRQRKPEDFPYERKNETWAEVKERYILEDGTFDILYPVDTPVPAQSSKASKSGKRSFFGKGVAIAAVFCLLIVSIPIAIGSEDVRTAIGKWNDTFFQLTHPGDQSTMPTIGEFHSDHEGLQQLHEELVKAGVTVNVVPTWLDHSLNHVETKITTINIGEKIYCNFASEDSYILFTIVIHKYDNNRYFFKDDVDAEETEIGGTMHYLVPNNGSWIAIWKNGNVECSIDTNLGKDVLLQILTSIYSGGI